MQNRKLLNIELGRVSADQYKDLPESGIVVVLDNVRSAHNVGSAFRTADSFKIDADTMVIASVTFINSPPFVPMMAAAMKNRRVLVTGLMLGTIGYAVGNYLGFLISELLKLL